MCFISIFIFLSAMWGKSENLSATSTTPQGASADAISYPREVSQDIQNAKQLMANSQYSTARDLLLNARKANRQLDVIHYLLADCFRQTGKPQAALGANYKIQNTVDDSLLPDVLLQRTQLLIALGLEETAKPVGLELIERFPESSQARTIRKLFAMKNTSMPEKTEEVKTKKRWKIFRKPDFNIQSYLKYYNTSQPVSADQGQSFILEPVMRDSIYREWRSRSRFAAVISFLEKGRFSLQGSPRLEMKYPFDSSYSSRYALGGNVTLERSPDAQKSDSWTLAYIYRWWDNYDPDQSITLDWTRLRETEKKGYWMFSTTAYYKYSEDYYKNGGYVTLTAYRNSAITIRRMSLDIYLRGMASSFRDFDNRLEETPFFASGISPGDTAWTYQDSLPAYLLVGNFLSNTLYEGGTGIELNIPVHRILSLQAGGECNISYYPKDYIWDNLDIWDFLFHNQDDNRFYLRDTNSVFKEYEYHTQKRMDTYYNFRISLELRLVGRLRFYFYGSVNNSNIHSSNPYQFDYRELVPGVDWRLKF